MQTDRQADTTCEVTGTREMCQAQPAGGSQPHRAGLCAPGTDRLVPARGEDGLAVGRQRQRIDRVRVTFKHTHRLRVVTPC